MKTWERTTGDEVEYVQVGNGTVTIGSHRGSGHSDSAVSLTFDEFLEDRYQRDVESIHGRAVLDEVLAAVNAMRS